MASKYLQNAKRAYDEKIVKLNMPYTIQVDDKAIQVGSITFESSYLDAINSPANPKKRREFGSVNNDEGVGIPNADDPLRTLRRLAGEYAADHSRPDRTQQLYIGVA